MEITKNQFIRLIKESSETQFDEMAAPAEADFRPIYVANDGELYVGDVKELRGKESKHIGWLLFDELPIIFTCGSEFNTFIEGHPDLTNKLEERFGDDVFWSNTKLPGCQVRRAPFEVKRLPGKEDLGSKITPDTKVKTPESSYGARNWILRGGNQIDGEVNPKGQNTTGLYGLIRQYLADDEMNAHLQMVSIPLIKPNERKYLDRYGDISNEKVEYGTHSYNSYQSSEDFLNAVVARIGGDELPVEYLDYHLARQFNKNYRNWVEDKKNQKEYVGKTEIYMLDRYGLEEKNLDLTIRSDFRVKGTLNNNNSFTWSLTFVSKFGRKLKEDRRLQRGLELDKDIVVTKTAQLDPNVQIDDQHPIIFNEQIRQALIDGLSEMRDNLMAIDPIETLSKANVQQFDVQRDVNENLKERLVSRILGQLKI